MFAEREGCFLGQAKQSCTAVFQDDHFMKDLTGQATESIPSAVGNGEACEVTKQEGENKSS